MKLATTTSDFSRFAPDLKSRLTLIRDAGFKYADVSLGGAKLFGNEGWRDEAKMLREHAEKIGISLVQAHSPNNNCLDPELRETEIEWGHRSLELCEILGIPNVVIHAGYAKMTREEWYEENAKFYRALEPTMEKTGVCVLTENTTHANLVDGYFYMYTGRDMVDFLEYANIPMLQAVWDTGHGTTEGSQYDNIVALGKHLQATHIHDNNGQADEHFIPYTGALNLDSVMNALLDINYQGYFTFEAIDTLRRIHNRHVKRQPFERDTRLLEPTLEMQIDLERLLYTIGKHCLSAYGVFEE